MVKKNNEITPPPTKAQQQRHDANSKELVEIRKLASEGNISEASARMKQLQSQSSDTID